MQILKIIKILVQTKAPNAAKAHRSNSQMLPTLSLPVSGSPIGLLKQKPDTPH
jgi:hypothetical protein